MPELRSIINFNCEPFCEPTQKVNSKDAMIEVNELFKKNLTSVIANKVHK